MSLAHFNNNLLQVPDSDRGSFHSLPNYPQAAEFKDDSRSSSTDQSEFHSSPTMPNSSRNLKSSILRNRSKSPNKGRRDSYGVVITSEIKQHKIRFQDNGNQVKVVENWKEFNIVEEKPCCICTLF